MKRTKRLVKEFGGKVMPFRELPIPAQLAVAHYMAIDGEAWQLPEGTKKWSLVKVQKSLLALLPEVREKYGSKRFGYVMIPIEALQESILNDPWLVEHFKALDSYEAYDERMHSHQGFRAAEHPTTNRWPVILSSEDEETLQDGWHRFDAYYHQGAKLIPAVYYP